jgi:hypothetical protein
MPADDLRIGDVIVHDGGETTVRELTRDGHTITTNPGSSDEISGYVWGHVAVRREEQQ